MPGPFEKLSYTTANAKCLTQEGIAYYVSSGKIGLNFISVTNGGLLSLSCTCDEGIYDNP